MGTTKPTAELLSAENVGRHFGSVRALSGISLKVAAGDCYLLTGANGAGKSTLLSILAGVLEPDRGQVRRVEELKTAYLGAQLMLYRELSVRENLLLFATALGAGADAATQVEHWLERFKLREFATRRIAEASSGVRRRAALCRCFLGSPALFLLDEPFAHMDAASHALTRSLLHEAQLNGAALVLATHDTSDLVELAGRELKLEAGRLV